MLLQARVKLQWQPLQQQEQLKLALAPQTLLALAPGVELDDEDSLLGGEACECYQAATTLPPPREGGPVAAQQLQQMATTMGFSRVTPESRIQNRSCGLVELKLSKAVRGFEALSPEFFDVSVSNRVLGRIQNAKSAAGRILSCLKSSTIS